MAVNSKHDRSPLDALFAVHYHNLWKERGLAHPSRLERLVRLPGHDEAVSLIAESVRNKAAHAPTNRMVARLCVAHLSRRAPPRHEQGPLRELLQALKDVDAIDPSDDHDDLVRAFTEPDDPSARFFTAFAHATFDASGSDFPIRHYAMSWSYVHCVTDVTVRVEVKRPMKDFEKCVDPRRWCVDVPDVWLKSNFIDQPPDDLNSDGTEVLPTNPKQQGIFFEEAVWPTRSLVLDEYRNLLNVDLDLSGAKRTPAREGNHPEIGFTYTQRECLTSDLAFLGTFRGGIDVDEGFGKCSATGDPAWCRLSARKRARFSQPRGPLNVLCNDAAAVWLPLLIEWLVLSGTQIPKPTP